MVPLDKLSTTLRNDLERNADLLGFPNVQPRPGPLLSPMDLCAVQHPATARGRDGTPFLFHVAVRDKRSALRQLHVVFRRMALPGPALILGFPRCLGGGIA